MKYCPNCGNEVNENDIYCNKCGQRLVSNLNNVEFKSINNSSNSFYIVAKIFMILSLVIYPISFLILLISGIILIINQNAEIDYGMFIITGYMLFFYSFLLLIPLAWIIPMTVKVFRLSKYNKKLL